MPKHLMIVESPAKAKTIEKYLGADFTVRASYGHVRDLPSKEMSIDIEHDFKPTYIISEDKKKVINELKDLIKKTDIVWLATDEDREGEAISWHLAEALGLNVATTNRVVFNEITKNAITKAIQKPRTIDMNLVNGQQARRVLDRLVGYKISPILWRKIRPDLSAGRVQSVAVRLIVEREREVINFQAVSSYRVTAEFLTDKKEVVKSELIRKFATKEEALAFLQSCISGVYTISNIETKPGKRSPAPPFTTSTLQQEASRKLGFSVKGTMRVAQTLYESGKITYMRTDSVNLSDTAMQQSEAAIKQLFGDKYHQPRKYKTKAAGAQEAHEAIRPTDFAITQIEGNSDEKRLYELIWKRATASQMADAQLERTTVDIKVSTNAEIFRAVGEVIKFDGFLKLYMESSDEDEDEETPLLPLLSVGQTLSLKEMIALERFTRPNPRYTEASLVKKLEELGIGRPSTYAPTISTVQDRQYIVRENKEGVKRELGKLILKEGKITETTKSEITGAEKSKLFPTDLGMLVNDFLVKHFEQVMDFSFTAKVEELFDEVAEGKKVWHKIIGDFYTGFDAVVEKAKNEADREKGERLLGTDEKTGKPVYAKMLRYGAGIQIGTAQDEEKPQYARLRSDQRLETITFEEAMELFKMPRLLGEYEGKKVKAGIGKFGPYVQIGDKFVTLPKEESPYDVTFERALELYAAKLEADAAKILRHFTPEIQILNGRWGPYIKYGVENIKIPKDINIETITLDDVERLKLEGSSKQKEKDAKSAVKIIGDFAILNGQYGYYFKHGKLNISLPKDADLDTFTEKQCQDLVAKKTKKK